MIIFKIIVIKKKDYCNREEKLNTPSTKQKDAVGRSINMIRPSVLTNCPLLKLASYPLGETGREVLYFLP